MVPQSVQAPEVSAASPEESIGSSITSIWNDLTEELQSSLEEQSLLFWSTFDFSVDAALYYLGPVDSFLREGDTGTCFGTTHNESHCRPLSPPSLDEFFEAADEWIGSFLHNVTTALSSLPKLWGFLEDEHKKQQQQQQQGTAASSLFGNLFGSSTTEDGAPTTGSRGKYSLFQKGDGSATDPDGIPTRFLDMHNGNRALAKQSLATTLQWRQENEIDDILIRPNPKFDIAKAVGPHYFLGRDTQGDVVFMLRPALMDLDLGKKNGLSHEDMLTHYIYVNEYLWQLLEGDKPLGTMTSVLDMTGMKLSMLGRRDMVNMLKMFVSTMDAHFPQRAHKTLILNSPKWVNALFKLCAPLMREATIAKIEIQSHGPEQDEALRKYFDTPELRESIPAGFWSTADNDEEEDEDDTDQDQDDSKNNKRKKDDDSVRQEREAVASFLLSRKMEVELRNYVSSTLAGLFHCACCCCCKAIHSCSPPFVDSGYELLGQGGNQNVTSGSFGTQGQETNQKGEDDYQSKMKRPSCFFGLLVG